MADNGANATMVDVLAVLNLFKNEAAPRGCVLVFASGPPSLVRHQSMCDRSTLRLGEPQLLPFAAHTGYLEAQSRKARG